MGILDKIKSVFNTTNEFDAIFDSLFNDIKRSKISSYLLKIKDLKTSEQIYKLTDKKKAELLIQAISLFTSLIKSKKKDQNNYDQATVLLELIKSTLTSKITLDDDDIENLNEAFLNNTSSDECVFYHWPINTFLNQIIKQYKNNAPSEQLTTTLKKLKTKLNSNNEFYYEKEKIKLIAKIDGILLSTESGIKPVFFLGKDSFSDYANLQIKNFPEAQKVIWYEILTLAQKSTGSKPTPKFLTSAAVLISKLGIENFKIAVLDWFEFIIISKDEIPTEQYLVGSFSLSSINVDVVKGLVWISSLTNQSDIVYKLSSLAERSFRKIPHLGQVSAALGNACLYSLYKIEGLEGIGQLSRLKLRIKQNNTQKLIENYLQLAADEQGISINEIEDLSADDFELTEGKRIWNFNDYKAEISIVGIGKTDTKWIKPDGNIQKGVPSFVKEKWTNEFNDLKNTIKQIEQNSSSQRDRIDRMFRSDRKMLWSHFNDYYINHGLISYITKKIIWNFTENGTTFSAIFHDGEWKTNKNATVNPSKDCIVSLWHPSTSSIETITNWRNYLVENKIQQPLKQAFREVYLLTDAEVNTKSYSNRMAAHILKQHQFNMLAKTRGWKYSLLGCFDDGRENGTAEIELKEHHLKAEFWINEVNADDAWNDAGIWNYVATDQVRFINSENNETIDLVDIPALVFSEIMRDVDLFVGVASVGNDPTWQDTGGIPAYRDYWQSYSFGDLTEIAKMRKDILINLVPRLKISKSAEIKDKFLIVKGKLRTYKIHIGSTNILMEPNDQYLCIVPDRSSKNHTENIFLPFEGDNGLSIILSKAFLLADDDKITDTTITSQINIK